ncbi:MAG: hypothetical protein AAGC88_11835 [Bacteroidota bacterium]
MELRIITALLIAATIFTGCEKDDEDDNPCETTTGNSDSSGDSSGNGDGQFVFVNSVGSYWVYDWYEVDYLTGVSTPTDRRDSIWIAGDTVIAGNEYLIKQGTWFTSTVFTSIQRDSSGYIVNQDGSLLWSYVNFDDTLNSGFNGLWDFYVDMGDTTFITTDAGAFSTIERNYNLYKESGDPVNTCNEEVITLTENYASGIGRVQGQLEYSIMLSQCIQYSEARLVDYYIAP